MASSSLPGTVPATMRALALSKFSKPSEYEGIATLATPQITQPNEVLIKVRAASVNPVDVKLANGYVVAFAIVVSPHIIKPDMYRLFFTSLF